MNLIFKMLVPLLAFSIMPIACGCNRTEHDSLLSLIGSPESVLVELWGPPTQTEGDDFEFYKPYTGTKVLFYERDGKNLGFCIDNGIVTGVHLIPQVPSATSD